jgi:hypothetical protein
MSVQLALIAASDRLANLNPGNAAAWNAIDPLTTSLAAANHGSISALQADLLFADTDWLST